MIVSKEEAQAIRKGDLDEVKVTQEPKGEVQAVQTEVGKKARFSVRVLDKWPHKDGGWMIRVERVPEQEKLRLMGRRGGYTDDPANALRDTAADRDEPDHDWTSLGVPPEPEAIDAQTEERFSVEARMRGRQAMAARQLAYENKPLIDRIRSKIDEAQKLGIDPRRDIERLEAGLAKLDRRIKRAKQQRRAA